MPSKKQASAKPASSKRKTEPKKKPPPKQPNQKPQPKPTATTRSCTNSAMKRPEAKTKASRVTAKHTQPAPPSVAPRGGRARRASNASEGARSERSVSDNFFSRDIPLFSNGFLAPPDSASSSPSSPPPPPLPQPKRGQSKALRSKGTKTKTLASRRNGAEQDNNPPQRPPPSTPFLLEIAVSVRYKTNGVVWGTNPYTNDSDISTAAVHCGLVVPKPGGRGRRQESHTVLLRLFHQPKESVEGSTQNGVETEPWDEPHSLFFELLEADEFLERARMTRLQARQHWQTHSGGLPYNAVVNVQDVPHLMHRVQQELSDAASRASPREGRGASLPLPDEGAIEHFENDQHFAAFASSSSSSVAPPPPLPHSHGSTGGGRRGGGAHIPQPWVMDPGVIPEIVDESKMIDNDNAIYYDFLACAVNGPALRRRLRNASDEITNRLEREHHVRRPRPAEITAMAAQ